MSISVIIPCYRAVATLRRAVDSALTGAPADLEVLLVDDGSPDDTGALCDELAAADPRVRALHRANGGAGAARNTGLDAAHGDWVLFLDADDALLPGLWAALDALTTDADMILFGLTRESSGAVKPTDYLSAGFCPDLQALGSALSPLLFDTGLLAAPYPKLFRRPVCPERTQLLDALRPFLSAQTCAQIDRAEHILSAARITAAAPACTRSRATFRSGYI